ncbi:MAG TPA: hypothetical protein VGF16_16575 [Bryobacteraceae bacterium]
MTDKAGNGNLRRGGITDEGRKTRYLRRIIRDDLEYEIPRSMALYLLDGDDKAQRLAESSRAGPCLSYTGQSQIWRETAVSESGKAMATDSP